MKDFKWSKTKPELIEECLLITASLISNHYSYTLYEIIKTEVEEGWYWGIFTADGYEWGDYADLKADLYLTMPLLVKHKAKLKP